MLYDFYALNDKAKVKRCIQSQESYYSNLLVYSFKTYHILSFVFNKWLLELVSFIFPSGHNSMLHKIKHIYIQAFMSIPNINEL